LVIHYNLIYLSVIIIENMKIYYLHGDITNKIKPSKKMYYFDNNSTTLIYDKVVKDNIMKWISCGNPSNTLHDYGIVAREKMEQCRHHIAADLNIYPCELYFTSGATESNNIAVQGIFQYYTNKYKNKKFTAITSSFEHPSVLKIFKHYEKLDNIDVVYINPCNNKKDPQFGCIKTCDVEKEIINAKNKVIVISIMHANNETGAIQNIEKMGKMIKKYNIYFHSDMTQSIGKFIIHPKEYYMGSISFSGHKFHGPKGIGGLYISKKYTNVLNLCYGGEQEYHRRPGTENVAYIVGMTLALSNIHKNRKVKNEKVKKMKKYIIDNISKKLNIRVLGPSYDLCLPNTLLILIYDIKTCNILLITELNKKGICVSAGSACQTNSGSTSHVLDTMDIKKEDKSKIIRISLSDYNTFDECEYLVKNLINTLKK